jgi:hypothetical protein
MYLKNKGDLARSSTVIIVRQYDTDSTVVVLAMHLVKVWLNDMRIETSFVVIIYYYKSVGARLCISLGDFSKVILSTVTFINSGQEACNCWAYETQSSVTIINRLIGRGVRVDDF